VADGSPTARNEGGNERRRARLQRIQHLQGARAGFVSRVMANAIDWSIAILIEVLLYLLVSVVIYLFTRNVGFPQPSKAVLLIAFWAIVVLYLTSGWASGATLGKRILGLRVTRLNGSVLGPRIAFVRALLCFAFLPGIVWVLFSKRNFSLQDLIVRSEVVYDWKYRSPAA
jgi:uncharacterized RDD family membrane protein YckC